MATYIMEMAALLIAILNGAINAQEEMLINQTFALKYVVMLST